jgi:hypothetical protein
MPWQAHSPHILVTETHISTTTYNDMAQTLSNKHKNIQQIDTNSQNTHLYDKHVINKRFQSYSMLTGAKMV